MALYGHERCVSKVPIFSHLEFNELEEVFHTVNHQKMKKGEFLFMAGETSSSLYVIHKGKVRIYRLNDNGEEQLIRVLTHSDFTGELSLFSDDNKSQSYAEVLEDAEICRINREDIYDLMKKYPDISVKIIESFAERLNESESLTTNISLLNSKEKLIEYIRTHSKGSQLILNMTKRNLASYLSMQPETLTRTFKKLEQEGYVRKVNNKTYDILK